ncbi:MAG: tetratricopeptide repeat protein [Bacteroidetes bacterium]|nr:tetratricopeptide repeat protein [Bacteroidota bacterium]
MNQERRTVWNPLYIGIIAYFCVLLPGLILFALNFEKLNRPQLKKPVLIAGILFFIFMLIAWMYLPESYDLVLEAFHIGVPVGLAAWQHPIYRRLLDDDTNEYYPESLLKPAVLSILFLLVFVGSNLGLQWWNHEQLKSRMGEAMQVYDSGSLQQAANQLNEIKHDYPGEQLAYINLAITYEAMGKIDSATVVLEEWLEIAPDDAQAKEMLYNMRFGGS